MIRSAGSFYEDKANSMHPSPQGQPSVAVNKIKHLLFEAEHPPAGDSAYAPFFYAEVRIDFNDVRTGYRTTVSLNKAVEIHSIYPDMLWAEDMVQDVDCRRIKSVAPEASFFGQLPGFVDENFMSQVETQFIQYLMRCHTAKVYRNSELNAYSNPGESLSVFTSRCLDLFDESKRQELDALHEVFTRRLEQVRQKYLSTNRSENLDRAKAESQDRNLFMSYSDRIADLFMQPEVHLNAVRSGDALSGRNPDLEERLSTLKSEARQAVARICDSYANRARLIDDYLLHPNLKDIHFVRCCILWIPARGA